MTTKKAEPEAQSLIADYEKALEREREAYERLSPEEQKKYRQEQELFQKKMDSMNYY